MPVGIVPREGHDRVVEEADAVLMAGLDQGDQVGGGSRGVLSGRPAELVARREEIGGAVAPAKIVVTVSRGEELERVDAQVEQMSAPGAQGEFGKAGGDGIAFDLGQDVPKGSDSHRLASLMTPADPAGRKLVDDQP